MSAQARIEFYSELDKIFRTIQEIVDESKECDADIKEDTEYLFSSLGCEEYMKKQAVIEDMYNKVYNGLPAHTKHSILCDVKRIINSHLISYKAGINSNAYFYDSKYQRIFKSISTGIPPTSTATTDDASHQRGFDQIVTFTPTQASNKFDLLYQKLDDDLKKHMGLGVIVNGSKSFVNYLFQIIRFACGATAYVGLCDVALTRYANGDVDGCEALMEQVMKNPIIMELQNFNYVPCDGVTHR